MMQKRWNFDEYADHDYGAAMLNGIGIWSIALAIILVFIFKTGTFKKIVLISFIIGFIEKPITICFNPFARGAIKTMYNYFPEHTIQTILIECTKQAVVTAVITAAIYCIVARRRKKTN